MARFFQDKGIAGTYRNRKQDFSVSRDARIMDVTPDGFRVQWNLELVRDLGLDKDSLAREFIDATDPQGCVSWG